MNRSNGSTGNPETAAPALKSHCRFCGGTSLRRSRLRASDFPTVLLLHWPVRCRRCGKRQFVFITVARQLPAANAPHTPEQLYEDSWQSFTSNESPTLRSEKNDEGKH